ncbi:MAG: 50S ribosomal protein L4 [Clostridia bacterium]|nr:50S ribosomal protein L4 [Clostridia bacterium]
MPNAVLVNMAGEKVKDITLNDNVFGCEVNQYAIHEVVVNYLANQRQGTQSTKTRSEVRGGGRKPWRQKGTGRARQGSIRAPQWTGGGVALGPKPRSYRYTVNKKVKRLAMRSVLSAKVNDGELIAVDNIALDEIKTKAIADMLTNLNAKKALILLPEKNDVVYRSARNIKGVAVSTVGTMNVYEILKYETLVTTEAAIAKIEEVYA